MQSRAESSSIQCGTARRGARFAATTNSALRAAAESAAARVGRFHPFFRRCFAFCWSAARRLSISFHCSDTHTLTYTHVGRSVRDCTAVSIFSIHIQLYNCACAFYFVFIPHISLLLCCAYTCFGLNTGDKKSCPRSSMVFFRLHLCCV